MNVYGPPLNIYRLFNMRIETRLKLNIQLKTNLLYELVPEKQKKYKKFVCVLRLYFTFHLYFT
jgi:hypothetical protein